MVTLYAKWGARPGSVVRLIVATPLAADPYHVNRVTGGFVVIDEATNATVAAGMVGTPQLLESDARASVAATG